VKIGFQQGGGQLRQSTTEDVESVISELKTALEQHIHLAKESLEIQVAPLLNSYGQARDAFLEAPW
jgi:hypothetical protein